ncbi:MAG: DUF1016 N-terminal domain-containing protein [Candidatus Bathyarchaeota archaeon]|nr:DUF1016 N-terminal domain-containing protein [Candidatus Termiticorpusculum sp.]
MKSIRKFYQVYSPSIQQTGSAQIQKGQTLSAQFKLTWSHYQLLMRIENDDVRHFYELETVSQQ